MKTWSFLSLLVGVVVALGACSADVTPMTDHTGEIAVTVSVGAVRTRPGVEPPELIDSADRALYVAKDAGRNRVELNDGPHRSDFAV